MRLLAIETATTATAIAALDADVATEVVLDLARRHTESLAPGIASLLTTLEWRPSDVEAVVVDVGPGLFTGLRVGIATAKGLAVATGRGLVAVSSTEVLAATAHDDGIAGCVACVVDARRGELFTQTFDCDGDEPVAIDEVRVERPEALASRLAGLGLPVTVVGSAPGVVRDEAGGDVTWREDLEVPSALAAARLAARRAANGERAVGHAEVHALYVREPDAVANFARRAPS